MPNFCPQNPSILLTLSEFDISRFVHWLEVTGIQDSEVFLVINLQNNILILILEEYIFFLYLCFIVLITLVFGLCFFLHAQQFNTKDIRDLDSSFWEVQPYLVGSLHPRLPLRGTLLKPIYSGVWRKKKEH